VATKLAEKPPSLSRFAQRLFKFAREGWTALIFARFVNKFTRLRENVTEEPLNQDATSTGRLFRMRFYGLTIAASAVVLGACAGGDKGTADTVGVATDTSAAAATATPPAATAPAATAPAAGGMAMAPITGATQEVKMVGDTKGYRFEPANITVKAGDGIKFTVVTGGPHNVAFDPATIPADSKGQLDANMGPEKLGELSSALKMNPGESVTISFGNIKPGKYPFHCTPHLALGMKGEITVQ
jgi:plastocyanin